MASAVVDLSCEGIGPCEVLRLRGSEAMNALPLWEVEILVTGAAPDLDAALFSPAVLRLFDPLEASERLVELIVAEARLDGAERLGARCTLVLRPAACLAAERSGYRVFTDRAAQDIVAEVLRDAGVPADRIELRLSGKYFQRPQCTQYDERDLTFASRLLAEDGIAWWFDDGDDGTRLVLADSMASHDGIPPPVVVPFEDGGGLVRTRSFSALERTEEVVPDAVFVRDFDVRNPDVLLDGKAGDGPLSVFEYPAFTFLPDASNERARVRLEQARRLAVQVRAEGDNMRVRPGRLLRIEGAADGVMNGEHLVVAVEHAYERPAPHDTTGRPYTNVATLVPRGESAFRPAAPAHRPRIDGIDSAITTGPAGEEIHVDDLGRLKLRFFWDPAGITDDRSSAWARTVQWSQGGSMALQRVGWEVPVMYLDGSPDRPIVLGRAYNAQRPVPYGLPSSSAVSTLQSATTPFDGTTNEIRMTDTAGSQEFRVQASRDQSVLVGGAADTTVGADETHDVGLMLAQVVLGSQAETIGGSRLISIGTDWLSNIAGSRTLTIGGMQHIEVGGNRAVSSKGSYAEVIGAAYLVQCNQSNTRVTGGFVQINAAGTALAAGLGVSESVAGARVELVGGAYSITAGGTYKDIVTGPKIVQAGAASENAAGDLLHVAKIASVKAGVHAVTAGGGITIRAPRITIKATSVVMGPLTIGGSFAVSAPMGVDAPTVKYKTGGSVGA